MATGKAATVDRAHRRDQRSRLFIYYGIEGITSVASTMLMVSIFFYTEHRFGWTLMQNFLLAAGQGVAYMSGALLAGGMSSALGRRRAVVVVHLLMAGITAVGIVATSQWVVTVVLL